MIIYRIYLIIILIQHNIIFLYIQINQPNLINRDTDLQFLINS